MIACHYSGLGAVLLERIPNTFEAKTLIITFLLGWDSGRTAVVMRKLYSGAAHYELQLSFFKCTGIDDTSQAKIKKRHPARYILFNSKVFLSETQSFPNPKCSAKQHFLELESHTLALIFPVGYACI